MRGARGNNSVCRGEAHRRSIDIFEFRLLDGRVAGRSSWLRDRCLDELGAPTISQPLEDRLVWRGRGNSTVGRRCLLLLTPTEVALHLCEGVESSGDWI